MAASLYHYTGQAGLLGIMDGNNAKSADGTIRLYSARHSNDRTEIELLIEAIDREADEEQKKRVQARDTPYHVMSWLRELKSSAQRLLRSRVYCVFSLSSHDDQLSQWRAYCRRPGGVSIGFDPEALERIAGTNSLEMLECEYIDPYEVARGLVDRLLHHESDLPPQNGGAVWTPGDHLWDTKLRRLVDDALSDVPRLKHRKFKEEAETRLVYVTKDPLSLRWDQGNRGVRPYYEIAFPLAAVREIIVGPSERPEFQEETTRLFLRSRGLTHITVRRSETPLIGD